MNKFLSALIVAMFATVSMAATAADGGQNDNLILSPEAAQIEAKVKADEAKVKADEVKATADKAKEKTDQAAEKNAQMK